MTPVTTLRPYQRPYLGGSVVISRNICYPQDEFSQCRKATLRNDERSDRNIARQALEPRLITFGAVSFSDAFRGGLLWACLLLAGCLSVPPPEHAPVQQSAVSTPSPSSTAPTPSQKEPLSAAGQPPASSSTRRGLSTLSPTTLPTSPPVKSTPRSSGTVVRQTQPKESRTAPASHANQPHQGVPSSAPAEGGRAAAHPASALDLASLEQRPRDTKAIGIFTKRTLKNQVDDLTRSLNGVC